MRPLAAIRRAAGLAASVVILSASVGVLRADCTEEDAAGAALTATADDDCACLCACGCPGATVTLAARITIVSAAIDAPENPSWKAPTLASSLSRPPPTEPPRP
jgi:hypothetical protein